MGTRCDLWSVAIGFTITVAGISALDPGELAAADAGASVRHLSGPALSPRLSDLPDMPPSASWQLKVTPPPRPSQLRPTPSHRPRGPDSAQPTVHKFIALLAMASGGQCRRSHRSVEISLVRCSPAERLMRPPQIIQHHSRTPTGRYSVRFCIAGIRGSRVASPCMRRSGSQTISFSAAH